MPKTEQRTTFFLSTRKEESERWKAKVKTKIQKSLELAHVGQHKASVKEENRAALSTTQQKDEMGGDEIDLLHRLHLREDELQKV